jgi:hypothetical protein
MVASACDQEGRRAMISESRRPVRGKGPRELDCPLYDHCLTQATRLGWKAWKCGDCPNLQMKAVRQRINYIEPYYELLAEIYPAFRARYEPIWGSLSLDASEELQNNLPAGPPQACLCP